MKAKPPSSQVADVRSPAERALDERRVGHFQSLMDQPDFGYKAETEAYDPLYKREFDKYNELVSGAAAQRGFGALRHGPSVSLAAQGGQEMTENRLAQERGERQGYRDWVVSGGKGSTSPQGRSAFMTPGRPSAFSQLAGPMMGAAGMALGGPMGAGLGMGLGSMFGGGRQQAPTQTSEYGPRRPESEGFGGGFGRGFRNFYGTQ